MKHAPLLRYSAITSALMVTLAISACGGGGGSSSTSSSGSSNLTVSGVAATGAALSGATVTVKCAAGTGSATSNTDGSYTVTVSGGSLPCMLEASSGGTTLHSVVTGTGSSATANITPLTELMVAQLTGADPTTYMSSVDVSTLSSTITDTKLSTARTEVVNILTHAGIDTSGLPSDLVGGTLQAAVNGSGGNAYDQALDALASTLTSAGSQLSTLTSTVASSSAASTNTTSSSADSGVSALAPELLLKPAAGGCDALRAADYWAVFSNRTGGAAVQKFRVSIEAGNAAITFFTSADTSTLADTSRTLTSNGTCRFTSSSGDDIVVSSAGIVAGRSSANEAFVAVPVQSHTLDELTGNWNIIAGDTADTSSGDTGWIYGYGTMTITGTGYEQFTQGCWFDTTTSPTCTNLDDVARSLQRPITLSSDGTFTNHSANDTTDGGPWQDRFFVYKTGKGDYFAISANIGTPGGSGDGSLGYATKVRTLSLPALSSVSSNWNISFNWTSSLVPAAIDAVSHTITAVDPNTSSFTRLTGTTGTSATHPETLSINTPANFNGFTFRDYVASAPVNGGGTTVVRKGYFLKTGSSGVTVVLQPYQDGTKPAKIVVSVTQPAS